MKAKQSTKLLLAAGVALAFGAGSVQAQESALSYNYVEALYQDGDVRGRDHDAIKVRASFSLNDSFFLKGTATRGETDRNVNAAGKMRIREYTAGIGYRVPINSTADLVTGFEYVHGEHRYPAGDRDRQGFAADMGLRAMVRDNIELQGGVIYRDAKDFGGDVGLHAEARLHMSPQFSITLGYQKIQRDSEGAHAGIRFSF